MKSLRCFFGRHVFPEDSWICLECFHSDAARRSEIEWQELDQKITTFLADSYASGQASKTTVLEAASAYFLWKTYR